MVVKKDASGISDLTPANFNVRTRVHEYGGGAFTVSAGIVYFTNFADQRLYAQLAFPGAEPIPLTPEGQQRFADFEIDVARDRLICVVEDHSGDDKHPSNYLAAVSLEGPSEGHFPADHHPAAATSMPRPGCEGRWRPRYQLGALEHAVGFHGNFFIADVSADGLAEPAGRGWARK